MGRRSSSTDLNIDGDDVKDLQVTSSDDTAETLLRSSSSTETSEQLLSSLEDSSRARRRHVVTTHHVKVSPSRAIDPLSPSRRAGLRAGRFCMANRRYFTKHGAFAGITCTLCVAAIFLSWSSLTTVPIPSLSTPLPFRPRIRSKMKRIHKASIQRHFTIQLKGDRIDLLHTSLDRHAWCHGVSSIKIDYEGSARLPESLIRHSSRKVNRPDETTTSVSDAILLLDQSVHLTCQELSRGFKEWRHDPTAVVGFVVSKTFPAIDTAISDRAVMLHRMYLMGRGRKHDMQPRADWCDQFTLSARISASTHKAPIKLHARHLLNEDGKAHLVCESVVPPKELLRQPLIVGLE